jgi:hypothetical protein
MPELLGNVVAGLSVSTPASMPAGKDYLFALVDGTDPEFPKGPYYDFGDGYVPLFKSYIQDFNKAGNFNIILGRSLRFTEITLAGNLTLVASASGATPGAATELLVVGNGGAHSITIPGVTLGTTGVFKAVGPNINVPNTNGQYTLLRFEYITSTKILTEILLLP